MLLFQVLELTPGFFKITAWREKKTGAHDRATDLRLEKAVKVNKQAVYRYFANDRGLAISSRHNAPLKMADVILLSRAICNELRLGDGETDYNEELKFFKAGLIPPFTKGHFPAVCKKFYNYVVLILGMCSETPRGIFGHAYASFLA